MSANIGVASNNTEVEEAGLTPGQSDITFTQFGDNHKRNPCPPLE